MLDVSKTGSLDRLKLVVTRIAEQHKVPTTVGPTDHLVDVGFTSMAMVDLMLAIEAEFDVAIPQREMTPTTFQSMTSLAHMLDRIATS